MIWSGGVSIWIKTEVKLGSMKLWQTFSPHQFPQNFYYFLRVNTRVFFLLYIGLNAWVSSRPWLGETPRPHTLISPSHGAPPPSPSLPAPRCTQRGQLPAKLQEHFCKYLPQTKLFLRPKTKALMSLYSTRTPVQPPKKTVEQAGNRGL